MVKCLFIILISAPALASESLYKSNCASCHAGNAMGIAGYSPRLASQHWQYLEQQMNDIRSGKRNNGNSGSMRSIFNQLTAEQRKSIAKYLSEL